VRKVSPGRFVGTSTLREFLQRRYEAAAVGHAPTISGAALSGDEQIGRRSVAIEVVMIAPSRTVKTSAFAVPEMSDSPRPTTASMTLSVRSDVTGSAVNTTPDYRGTSICWTTTAMRA
jgi:hypothetical protein